MLTLVLYACGPAVPWYPPPVQYHFDPNTEPRVVGAVAAMDDPQVENYILSGVLPGERGSPWRWANEKAELRFQLGELKPTKFFVDYVIPDSTFKLTGPVKVSVSIDGKPAGTADVRAQGQQHLTMAVDASKFDPVTAIVVRIEVDKFYQSEHDGTRLGFMLQRAGFEQ